MRIEEKNLVGFCGLNTAEVEIYTENDRVITFCADYCRDGGYEAQAAAFALAYEKARQAGYAV